MENQALRLPPISDIGCILGGSSAIEIGGTKEPQSEILHGLAIQVRERMPNARHWLMVGHSTWQPNNRLVIYNRLWRSLSYRFSLPKGSRSEEFMVESEHGVRFFGYIEIETIHTDEILVVLQEERACTIVASWSDESRDELHNMAQSGWERAQIGPPLNFLKVACRNSIGVYTTLGDFDDRERGAAFIAHPRWIETIFSREEC